MLSAHFNQLVGSEALALDEMACLNIHPSLLPAYKGVDPAFYALLREEREVGVTVHFQEAEFDVGRMLAQERLIVDKDDNLLSLNLKLFKLGVLNAIRQIQGMGLKAKGQLQDKDGNYDSWPDVFKVKMFRRSRKLFRWRDIIFRQHL